MFDEQLTTNFKLSELTVTDTGLPNEPGSIERERLKRLAVNVLQPWRDLIGSPIVINSGYRSHEVNTAVGGVANSQHRYGEAADVRTPKTNLWDAYVKLVNSNIPFDQAIYERKGSTAWVHVSYSILRQRRQALLAEPDANGNMKYSNYVV